MSHGSGSVWITCEKIIKEKQMRQGKEKLLWKSDTSLLFYSWSNTKMFLPFYANLEILRWLTESRNEKQKTGKLRYASAETTLHSTTQHHGKLDSSTRNKKQYQIYTFILNFPLFTCLFFTYIFLSSCCWWKLKASVMARVRRVASTPGPSIWSGRMVTETWWQW